jgi:hypothetical protein
MTHCRALLKTEIDKLGNSQHPKQESTSCTKFTHERLFCVIENSDVFSFSYHQTF